MAELFGQQARTVLEHDRVEQGVADAAADQLRCAVAEQSLGSRVEALQPAKDVGGHHRGGGAAEDGLLQRGLLGVPARQQALLEQAHHLAAEATKRVALIGAQPARLAVDHAEGAEIVTVRGAQQGAGIEADAGLAGHQRVVAKARVSQGVRHLEDFAAADRMAAEGDVARRFTDRKAHPALEPLAAIVDQRDQRDRRIAQARSQLGEIVEGRLFGRVEDFVAQQRRQPGQLVVVRIGIRACFGWLHEWPVRGR